MINVFEKITNTLMPLGYTIKEQGSFGENEKLPETFLTFFIVDSSNKTHYDNVACNTSYRVQITMYSKKPSIVQSSDSNIKNLMILAGFMRINGRSLPFNKESGHYAWTQDYNFLDMED